MNDNSPSKTIIETHQVNLSPDKSQHASQNQSILPNTSIDKTLKTRYNQRHQPKKGLSYFHITFKTLKTIIHYTELNESW